jgi:hypothetical protein
MQLSYWVKVRQWMAENVSKHSDPDELANAAIDHFKIAPQDQQEALAMAYGVVRLRKDGAL